MVQFLSKAHLKYLFLPVSAFLIDLAYVPHYFDPLNPVKFFAIVFISIICVSWMSTQFESIFKKKSFNLLQMPILVSILFISTIFFAFLFTDIKSIGLLGFTGRNNGLLSYSALVIIFLFAVFNFNQNNLQVFYFSILVFSFVFSLYGTIQHFGKDFLKWKTDNNPISLTVGNPDFAAALLGLFSIILVAFACSNVSVILRVFIVFEIIFALLVIYWSQARQGLIATALGAGIVLTSVIFNKSKRFAIGVAFFELATVILAILGMLQKGPLTKYLYKASINDRGYDWRAAWHMFRAHPLFGVGIDRYAGSFFEYRDGRYPLLYGYSQTVNNAHNIFLELLATGGIFVGLSYIALVIFIFFCGLQNFKKYSGSEKMLVIGIFSAWVGFQAISFISVDNLSVSIWGWILGGAIIGLSITGGQKSASKSILKNGVINRFKPILVFFVLSILFFPVLVSVAQCELRMYKFESYAVPKDASSLSAYERIADSAFNSKFMNPDYRILIAFNVTNAGDLEKGTLYFKKILEQDPRRTDANIFLATIYEHNGDLPNAIRSRIRAKVLDPYNAPNLLQLEKDYLAQRNFTAAKNISNLILKIAPDSKIANQATSLIKE